MPPGGVNLADEDAHGFVLLEAVHQRQALAGRHLAGDAHRLFAQGALQTVGHLGEAGIDDHLLVLRRGAAHEIQGLRHLRHGDGAPGAGEHPHPVPEAALGALAAQERAHRVVQAVAHVFGDVHVHPGTLFGGQIQHLVLGAPQHDAL